MNKFSGEIEAQSVVDLLQIYVTQNQPVKIIIKENLFEAHVWVDNGSIIHAEVGDLNGIDAFYQAILMEKGSFHVEMGSKSQIQTIFKPFTELVLESFVLLDEGKIKKQEPKVNKRSDSFKSWQAKLEDFVVIDGFHCALLIDSNNGMCIFDKYKEKNFHLKADQISAFLTEDLKNKRKIESSIESKLNEEISVFDKYYLIYRLINKKYILAVLLDVENTNLAMARIILEENCK